MQTPSANHLIRNDIDKFWQDKISLVIDTSDIRSFVGEYLPLLSVDYDVSIAAAILHVQQSKAAKVQSLISEIITPADSPRINLTSPSWLKLSKTNLTNGPGKPFKAGMKKPRSSTINCLPGNARFACANFASAILRISKSRPSSKSYSSCRKSIPSGESRFLRLVNFLGLEVMK